MNRFPSVGVSDFHTRQVLRERLQKALVARPVLITRVPDDGAECADIAALSLLQGTRITRHSSAAEFRSRYEEARQATPDIPEFEEALLRGWFFERLGHVLTARAFTRFLHQSRPSYSVALLQLLHWSWGIRFAVPDILRAGAPANLLAKLDAADADNFKLPVRTPVWVAARLWDMAQNSELKDWLTKWHILGAPAFTIDDVWSEEVAKPFTTSALQIAAQLGLANWADLLDVERRVRLSDTGDARGTSEPRPAPPSHLLGKFMLIRGPQTLLDRHEELLLPVWLVLLNLARRATGPLPYPEVQPLVELASNHPEVLDLVQNTVGQEPLLLADLLMHPTTAVVATLWVAGWPTRARNEAEEEPADRDQRVAAFKDCTRMLGEHLRENALDPAEVSELFIFLQTERSAPDPAAEARGSFALTILWRSSRRQPPNRSPSCSTLPTMQRKAPAVPLSRSS